MSSIESTLFESLKGLVASRVYPDVAPENTVRPYITYQQVGGRSINFVDNQTPITKHWARFQLNVWGDSRVQAAALAAQVVNTLRAVVALQTDVAGEPIATFDAETKLRGSIQDFVFFY